MLKSKMLLLTSFLLILGISAAAVSAISGVSISIPGEYEYEIDTCSDGNSYQWVDITLTGTTDDGGGYDEFATISFDGNGNVIDVDLNYIAVSTTDTIYDLIDPGIGTLSNPVTRPFTFVVYDIPSYSPGDENTPEAANWIMANGTEVARTTFDPSFDPACGELPLAENVCIAIPDGSVVGDLPFQTQAFYSPGKISPDVFLNPGTYWVIGQDETHEYYEIVLSCQYLWVPVNAMQPSYQAPQNGAPLPTRVVD